MPRAAGDAEGELVVGAGVDVVSGVGLAVAVWVAVGAGVGVDAGVADAAGDADEALGFAPGAPGGTGDGTAATGRALPGGTGVDQPPSGNAFAPPHAATHRITGTSSKRSGRTVDRNRMCDSSGIAGDRSLAPGGGPRPYTGRPDRGNRPEVRPET